MVKLIKYVLLAVCLAFVGNMALAQVYPNRKKLLSTLELANAYFMQKWPDPGKSIITNKERPSKIWKASKN